MFDFLSMAAIQQQQSILRKRANEHAFKTICETYKDNPAGKERALKAYRDMLKETRIEAAKNRRNKELCQAIRDSKPRGLGLFW